MALTENDPEMGEEYRGEKRSNVQGNPGRVAQKCMLLAQNARLRTETRPYLRGEATPITNSPRGFLMRRKLSIIAVVLTASFVGACANPTGPSATECKKIVVVGTHTRCADNDQ
jgi:hypothetical protein